MPYIPEWARQDDLPVTAGPGDLNFHITMDVLRWIQQQGGDGVSYATLNQAIGVLECVKQELYRRVVSPYEDEKMAENGDVFGGQDV